ncbi:hypothetical protein J3R30DRAFT_3722860 [Lentinula aciculospora]|uniref:Uncharacterized protein n=1 Tax=Lentinula aciculospora TaxID=153920 RepID=A0A9W8ZU12_9AGAR|nr:hypothetical protein J3R30DRAFT_3722860 [Lentinula aciculospora]
MALRCTAILYAPLCHVRHHLKPNTPQRSIIVNSLLSQPSPLHHSTTVHSLRLGLSSSSTMLYMTKATFYPETIHHPDTLCQLHDDTFEEHFRTRSPNVIMFKNAVLKMAGESCRADFCWLKAFEVCELPFGSSVLQLCSKLSRFDVDEDTHMDTFAMVKTPDMTMDDYLRRGKKLEDRLADQIVQSLVAVRDAAACIQTHDAIPNMGPFLLKGFMFPESFRLLPNERVEWTVSTQDDVKHVLESRVGPINEGWEWAAGDLSPNNIYLSFDGHGNVVNVTFGDFETSMWLPKFYDWWTLDLNGRPTVGIYPPSFTAPLTAAFACYYSEDRPEVFSLFDRMRALSGRAM